MIKLPASLLVAACAALAFNANATTDKTGEPTTAATSSHDSKTKTSQQHKTSTHSKKSTHKSDAKPADAKPAEQTK